MHHSFLSRRPAQILPERESSEYHEWGALGFLIRDIGVIRGQMASTSREGAKTQRKGRIKCSLFFVLSSWCLVLGEGIVFVLLVFFVASVFGIFIRAFRVIRGQTTWVHAKALRRKGRGEGGCVLGSSFVFYALF